MFKNGIDERKKLKEIEDCLIRCDADGLSTSVEKLLKITSVEDASRDLSALFLKHFTTYKADGLAKLMELVIRKEPKLAMVNFPENYLFRLSIITGSKELYECYIEEAIIPYWAKKSTEKKIECYLDLYGIAEQYSQAIFPTYNRCIKGLHFNGAFGEYEKNENTAFINKDDFEIINEVVEKYNAIIGRRDIINDVFKRSDIV